MPSVGKKLVDVEAFVEAAAGTVFDGCGALDGGTGGVVTGLAVLAADDLALAGLLASFIGS